MSKTIPHVPLLVESTLYVRTNRVRLKGVLVEQDSEVRVGRCTQGTAQRCAGHDHWLLEE